MSFESELSHKAAHEMSKGLGEVIAEVASKFFEIHQNIIEKAMSEDLDDVDVVRGLREEFLNNIRDIGDDDSKSPAEVEEDSPFYSVEATQKFLKETKEVQEEQNNLLREMCELDARGEEISPIVNQFNAQVTRWNSMQKYQTVTTEMINVDDVVEYDKFKSELRSKHRV